MFEHGTPERYDSGCTKHDKCPAAHTHGLSCETAHIRLASSEMRYMRLRGQHRSPAAIARALGLQPVIPLVERPLEPEYLPAPKGRPAMGEQAEAPKPAPVPVHIVGPVGDDTPPPAKPSRKKATPAPEPVAAAGSGPSASTIRAWCAEVGVEVNPHGRVPDAVYAKYAIAHAEPETGPVTAADITAMALHLGIQIDPWQLDALHRMFPAPTAAPEPTAEVDEHPDWGTVATSNDIERYRTLAAHLWDENEALAASLATAHRALELTLPKWAQVREERDLARHQTAQWMDVASLNNRAAQRYRTQLGDLTRKLAETRAALAEVATNPLTEIVSLQGQHVAPKAPRALWKRKAS